MFPGRFFSPRYWAERYFSHGGEEVAGGYFAPSYFAKRFLAGRFFNPLAVVPGGDVHGGSATFPATSSLTATGHVRGRRPLPPINLPSQPVAAPSALVHGRARFAAASMLRAVGQVLDVRVCGRVRLRAGAFLEALGHGGTLAKARLLGRTALQAQGTVAVPGKVLTPSELRRELVIRSVVLVRGEAMFTAHSTLRASGNQIQEAEELALLFGEELAGLMVDDEEMMLMGV